jgi:hypothetical protein
VLTKADPLLAEVRSQVPEAAFAGQQVEIDLDRTGQPKPIDTLA